MARNPQDLPLIAQLAAEGFGAAAEQKPRPGISVLFGELPANVGFSGTEQVAARTNPDMVIGDPGKGIA